MSCFLGRSMYGRCSRLERNLGCVWIGAYSGPTKKLVVDRAWVLVWMRANNLSRPASISIPSSVLRQLLGEPRAAESCANPNTPLSSVVSVSVKRTTWMMQTKMLTAEQ